MKKIIPLMLIAAFFISSCKDDPDPVCKTDATSIAGSYRITAVIYRASPTTPEENYYNIFFPDACQRDDVYTFQTNGTYQLKDAGAVCSPSGDDNGTWSVNGNNMVVDGDPSGIESFDCKTLVISSSDLLVTGDKLKLTLVRQ